MVVSKIYAEMILLYYVCLNNESVNKINLPEVHSYFKDII